MIEEYIGWLDDDWNTVLDLSQPIVRCKDCMWKSRFDSCMRLDEWHESEWFTVESDGFCSWGERITANGGDDEVVE